MYYENEALLTGFLNYPGNGALASPLMRIDGVLGVDGAPSSLYAVMVGLGRFVQHYQGIRKQGPNVVLQVDVSKGVNDGLVRVVASSRNKTGERFI